jgi:hypothetical protein
MRTVKLMVVVSMVAAFTSLSWADCGKCGPDKAECSAECGSICCQDALAKFPKMTFRIADHETCCSHSAAKLAEDHEGETMKFVVAEKVYEDKAEAMTALADVAEKFVTDFSSPHTCEVSGTTTVAGKSLNCSVTAGKMAETVKEAMHGVQMVYKVGDETCSCPNQAEALAKEAGTDKQYVVNDQETCCVIDARIKLAAAKYKAALEALAEMQTPETASAES